MDHGWADRPPSAFSCLAQSPYLLGKLPAAEAATIKPDSSSALATFPFSLPPPITPAIISLVQNELLQLQPRQLFHLGANAGAWWLGPRGLPSWLEVGSGDGVEDRESRRAWAPTYPSPWAPVKAWPPFPASPGVQTPPPSFPRAFKGWGFSGHPASL